MKDCGQDRAMEDCILGGHLTRSETGLLASETQKLPVSTSTPQEEMDHAEGVLLARNLEIRNWSERHASLAVDETMVNKRALDKRWVLTWKRDGAGLLCVEARLVAKGFQDPDAATTKVSSTAPVARKEGLLLIAAAAALGGLTLL